MRRLLGGLIILLVWPGLARATSAITISPAAHEVVLDPATSERELSFKITNQTLSDLSVSLTMADFGPLDETGGIAFLGDEDRSWQHRLTPWLSLDRDQLNLAVGQSQIATVRIHNREDLTPGGHYAAVLATMQDATTTSPAQTAATLQGVMSAQFYVVKTGGEKYNLELLDLWPADVVWRWPTTTRVRLRAGGNSHVKAYGTMMVNGGGQMVAKGVVNEDSALILPGATRVLETALRRLHWVWPGRYQLVMSLHDQANEKDIELTRVFWYIPTWLFIPLILGLIILWRRRV